MSSAQFNTDLFALANGAHFATDSTYTTYGTEHPVYTVKSENSTTTYTLTLRRTPVADSVSIPALNKDSDSEVPFTVSGKVITFADAVTGLTNGQEVEVNYEYTVSSANVAQIDNKTTAIGEAIFRWPVYGSGEDCTESSIKGYVEMKLYRCRVTAMPKQNWAA